MTHASKVLGLGEFATLTALLFSLVALSIDAMLPAFPAIAEDLFIESENDVQLVIGLFFLGNGFGQLLFGPLSDSFGRRPMILIGLIVFMIGCVMSMVAQSFELLLIGRILQGVGAAGPRTVTVSMVRDLYSGVEMARIMSIAMAIFILVPTLAPAIGQVVILFFGWRYIFLLFLLMSCLALAWLVLRQPETLLKVERRTLSISMLLSSFMFVCRNRSVVGYVLAMGVIFGAFVGFLSSAQQVFEYTFSTGKWFPLCFASLAITLGIASLVNSRLVKLIEMQRIVLMANYLVVIVSAIYALLYVLGYLDGLVTFMVWGGLCFFGLGLMFGNLNTLAIQPLGEVAGMGAAIIGFGSTIISIILGVPIGRAFNLTEFPLVLGFVIMGTVSLCLVKYAGNHRRLS